MLSPDEVRTILNDPDLSDEEAEAIRDAYRTWAELLLALIDSGGTANYPMGSGFELD